MTHFSSHGEITTWLNHPQPCTSVYTPLPANKQSGSLCKRAHCECFPLGLFGSVPWHGAVSVQIRVRPSISAAFQGSRSVRLGTSRTDLLLLPGTIKTFPLKRDVEVGHDHTLSMTGMCSEALPGNVQRHKHAACNNDGKVTSYLLRKCTKRRLVRHVKVQRTLLQSRVPYNSREQYYGNSLTRMLSSCPTKLVANSANVLI